MSERVLEACVSRIPLQQLISFTDELMQSKEKEDQEIQNDLYLMEFVECAKFKHVSIDERCQKAATACKPLPNPRDSWFSYPKLTCVEQSRVESEHGDSFIPNELLIGKKLHPLIALLLVLEKLKALQLFYL